MKEQDLYKALSGKDEVLGAFHEAMKRTLDALPSTISKYIRPYQAIRRTAAALLAAEDERFARIPVVLMNDYSKAGSAYWGNTRNRH